MTDIVAPETTFASGRYSKRKRTQVTYVLDEFDVSDNESDFETRQVKKSRASIKRTKPLPKEKIFPFMRLPAEIRNLIYDYALTDPAGIHLVATFKHRRRTVERVVPESQVSMKSYYRQHRINDEIREKYGAPTTIIAPLLAVSKQVYHEAKDVLYSNKFIFADTFALYSLLINLGPSGSQQLKYIKLLGWGYGRALKAYNHACFATLVWATNLKEFHIESTPGYYRSLKSCAEQIYRDAFPWLEAVGRATGKVDGAMEILKLDPAALERRGYYGAPNPNTGTDESRVQEFNAALRRFLGAQQKRLMTSTTKRRKVTKTIVSDEL